MTSTFMSFPLPDLEDKTPFKPTVISKWLRLCQKQGLSFLLVLMDKAAQSLCLQSLTLKLHRCQTGQAEPALCLASLLRRCFGLPAKE